MRHRGYSRVSVMAPTRPAMSLSSAIANRAVSFVRFISFMNGFPPWKMVKIQRDAPGSPLTFLIFRRRTRLSAVAITRIFTRRQTRASIHELNRTHRVIVETFCACAQEKGRYRESPDIKGKFVRLRVCMKITQPSRFRCFSVRRTVGATSHPPLVCFLFSVFSVSSPGRSNSFRSRRLAVWGGNAERSKVSLVVSAGRSSSLRSRVALPSSIA